MRIKCSKLLFVNSLDSSGIGDFGKSLFSGISPDRVEKNYLNTSNTLRSLFNNWVKIFNFSGKVLVNLGFTSYGKSRFLNFANFLLIYLHSSLFSGRIEVILHDSPDLPVNDVSGYEHFNLIRFGGAIATKLLKNIQLHVFSVTLFSILTNKYGLTKVHFHPFPCLEDSEPVSSDKTDFSVISIGYIAPYKGLEIIHSIKQEIPDVDFIIGGSNHPVLSKTEKGRDYITNLLSLLSEVGVDFRGYVSEKEIRDLLSKRRLIGILPYKATSGSSYAATYFMELGIPLITSDLPEFRCLYEYGAGIFLSDRNTESFTQKILELKKDLSLYQDLVKRATSYCKRYSVENFLDEIGI